MDRPAPASFAGTAKAALTRPTLSWSNKRLEVKSRWYRAKNRLSTLQLAQISSSFGTLKILAQTNYVVSGRDITALQLGFDMSLAASEEEFIKAKDLDVNGAVLDMVDDSELDAKGNFVPVPERAIHLEGVPYSLFEADKVLEEGLSAYATFPEGARKWGSPDGVYSGKVRLRIKDIKSPVPEFVTVKFEGSTVRLRTNVSGVPQGTSRVKVCFKCRGNHHAPECPKKIEFKWKCTECGLDYITCTVGKCKMADAAGKIRAHMTEVKATQEDVSKGRTYANFMDKFKKLMTDLHSGDPKLCLEIITTVKEYPRLTKQYDQTRSVLFDWLDMFTANPTIDTIFLKRLEPESEEEPKNAKKQTEADAAALDFIRRRNARGY